jgi:hypothetical protein
VGVDGVNGDTLRGVHHPLALEHELALATDEMLNWNTMSWGLWRYGFVPS